MTGLIVQSVAAKRVIAEKRMTIDFESTSFGFNRRRGFVKSLVDARKEVAQRRVHPGHESVARLDRLLAALDDVLSDPEFEKHARQSADNEREPLPAKT